MIIFASVSIICKTVQYSQHLSLLLLKMHVRDVKIRKSVIVYMVHVFLQVLTICVIRHVY